MASAKEFIDTELSCSDNPAVLLSEVETGLHSLALAIAGLRETAIYGVREIGHPFLQTERIAADALHALTFIGRLDELVDRLEVQLRTLRDPAAA